MLKAMSGFDPAAFDAPCESMDGEGMGDADGTFCAWDPELRALIETAPGKRLFVVRLQDDGLCASGNSPLLPPVLMRRSRRA